MGLGKVTNFRGKKTQSGRWGDEVSETQSLWTTPFYWHLRRCVNEYAVWSVMVVVMVGFWAFWQCEVKWHWSNCWDMEISSSEPRNRYFSFQKNKTLSLHYWFPLLIWRIKEREKDYIYNIKEKKKKKKKRDNRLMALFWEDMKKKERRSRRRRRYSLVLGKGYAATKEIRQSVIL